jgi:hypothetical protein
LRVLHLLVGGFVLLHGDTVSVRERILTNTCYLPRHFQAGFATRNPEPVVLDLLGYIHGREGTDARELIVEVSVEGIEPVGHLHPGLAAGVEDHMAPVDVEHVGTFDEGVVKVPIGGVEGVVYFEGATSLREIARDLYVARE